MFRTKWHAKSCGAGVSLAVGEQHVVESAGMKFMEDGSGVSKKTQTSVLQNKLESVEAGYIRISLKVAGCRWIYPAARRGERDWVKRIT